MDGHPFRDVRVFLSARSFILPCFQLLTLSAKPDTVSDLTLFVSRLKQSTMPRLILQV
jgi:hypothetical protein